MKLKAACAITCFIVLSLTCYSQININFLYDASGNRVERVIDMNKSAQSEPGDSSENNYIREMIGNGEITIYPNPTRGILTIEMAETGIEGSLISLHDLNGKLILQQPVTITVNEVDLTGVPSGIYFLTILMGNDKGEWKIIKQ